VSWLGARHAASQANAVIAAISSADDEPAPAAPSSTPAAHDRKPGRQKKRGPGFNSGAPYSISLAG